MTNVDFIANGNANGVMGQALQANGLNASMMRPFLAKDPKTGLLGAYVTVFKGGDVKDIKNYAAKPIQANATLRRDEWIALDEAVQLASRQRLVGVGALEDAGLVYNLGNGMGTTVLEYTDMADFGDAQVDMEGLAKSKNDRPDYGTHYLPLPIIHSDYQINARALSVSRNMGNALDTTSAEQAARKVAELLEDMLFTARTFKFGGGTIYSYINHPDRNPQTLTLAWDDASKTPKQILDDVLTAKGTAIADGHFGPYDLYIPTAYEVVLDNDYITAVSDVQQGGTSQTIRERILKVDGVKAIKVADRLPANNIVLVQMTSNVVRLVKGMAIQNVEWESHGRFVTNYKVFTIQVPQIRSDADSKSGIVHIS